MFKPKVRRFLEDECKKVIDKLKAMSFAELPERGKTLDTVVNYSDCRQATVSVTAKVESPECVMVVVQCFMPMKGIWGWLRVKDVEVDGFTRYADGRTEQLENSKLYKRLSRIKSITIYESPLPLWERVRVRGMRLSQPEFAKQLRRNQTDVERKMWSLLRSRSLSGYKFRRQQKIGPYVVDFCCFRPRVIIELDGSQHMEQAGYDQRRTELLSGQGYQVVRFWDNQILRETDSVLEAILKVLEAAPSPRPSPTGGRGGIVT